MIFKIISGNHFNIQGHCKFTIDLVINRGHLLVMTNHLVKYENLMINKFQENEWKPFWHSKSLLPVNCQSDPKINRDHLLVMTNLSQFIFHM